MKYTRLIPVLIAILIVACGSPPPPLPTPVLFTPTNTPPPTLAPTPNINATVEAQVEQQLGQIMARTATAFAAIPPTATSTSTATPVPTVSATPSPVPTSTLAPSPTATQPPEPTTTGVPTSTALPTSTPTIVATQTSSGPTEISGLLSGDNFWTLDGSPYVLTNNLTVNEGSSLAIDPGVEVELNGRYLRVNGLLKATGNSMNKITFIGRTRTSNGNYLAFGPTAESWDEDTGEGSVVVHTIFRVNTELNGHAIKVEGSAPRFSNIEVTNARASGLSLQGPAILEDSRICDNFDWGVLAESSAVIRRNIICGNRMFGILVRDSSPQITENIIRLNNWLNNEMQGGISVEIRRVDGAPVIQRNNISDNLGYGIRVLGERVVGNTVISQNIIANNEAYNARVGETRADVDMTRNWWGTTNRDIIAEKLYDEADGFVLRRIFFLPLSSSPPVGVPAVVE